MQFAVEQQQIVGFTESDHRWNIVLAAGRSDLRLVITREVHCGWYPSESTGTGEAVASTGIHASTVSNTNDIGRSTKSELFGLFADRCGKDIRKYVSPLQTMFGIFSFRSLGWLRSSFIFSLFKIEAMDRIDRESSRLFSLCRSKLSSISNVQHFSKCSSMNGNRSWTELILKLVKGTFDYDHFLSRECIFRFKEFYDRFDIFFFTVQKFANFVEAKHTDLGKFDLIIIDGNLGSRRIDPLRKLFDFLFHCRMSSLLWQSSDQFHDASVPSSESIWWVCSTNHWLVRITSALPFLMNIEINFASIVELPVWERTRRMLSSIWFIYARIWTVSTFVLLSEAPKKTNFVVRRTHPSLIRSSLCRKSRTIPSCLNSKKTWWKASLLA